MSLSQPLVPRDLLAFFTADNPFFQFTMDILPVPVFYKDVNGVYLGCNQAFEQFIKISKADLVGYSAHELFEKNLADAYQQADQALFDNPGVQIYEKEIRTHHGEPVFVKFHKTSFFDEQGNVAGLIGVIFDITEQKALQAKLTQQATFDDLTGFYNRREGVAIAAEQMKLAVSGKLQFGVMMLDIDHFKHVNDQYGHSIGDKVLQHTAAIIEKVKPPATTLIRWGGEEFLILLTTPLIPVDGNKITHRNIDFKQEVITAANHIRRTIASTPIMLEHQPISISLSGGVSCYVDQSLREIINQADELLYHAKANGRNQVCG